MFQGAVIGITEIKLDKTVYNSEVAVDGYNILWNNRNKKGSSVAGYIRNNIWFSSK